MVTLSLATFCNQVPEVAREYMFATQGLAASHQGDYQRALDMCSKVPFPDTSALVDVGNIKVMLAAFVLLTRSMTEHKLEHPIEAKRDYDAAVALIPKELKVLGTSEYKGPLPVDQRIVDHDWLMAEVLRREAEKLLATGSVK